MEITNDDLIKLIVTQSQVLATMGIRISALETLLVENKILEDSAIQQMHKKFADEVAEKLKLIPKEVAEQLIKHSK
jgi:hypothetical protein